MKVLHAFSALTAALLAFMSSVHGHDIRGYAAKERQSASPAIAAAFVATPVSDFADAVELIVKIARSQ
jgi:hypothetical protein